MGGTGERGRRYITQLSRKFLQNCSSLMASACTLNSQGWVFPVAGFLAQGVGSFESGRDLGSAAFPVPKAEHHYL